MCHLSPRRVRFLMRRHGHTIRSVSSKFGIPMARVRQVRDHGVWGHGMTADWVEILTGRNIWNRELAERMEAA